MHLEGDETAHGVAVCDREVVMVPPVVNTIIIIGTTWCGAGRTHGGEAICLVVAHVQCVSPTQALLAAVAPRVETRLAHSGHSA